ncbi:hypothetical protein MY3296_007771 [Beauveria thailandica]
MKLTTTIVMLGLAVVNAVASPVIRDTSDAETNNVGAGILEANDQMAASKGPCPRGSQLQLSSRGTFRAIVLTGNGKLVGIIEYAAENNVKSVWDIKALTKEGKWLKPGVKGDRVTGDNGLHYARKDKEIVCSLPKEGEFLRYKELISEKNLLAMLRLARS